jgi:carboxypeptidase Taq
MQELRERLSTIEALDRAESVLSWDEETYMPEAGGKARAEQASVLARLRHELFVSPETETLLAAAERSRPVQGSVDGDLVRMTRLDYDRALRVPASLVAEMRRHASLAHPIWVHARENDDFASFVPVLEKTVELSRRLADHLGYAEEPYDALIDQFEPGMSTRQVDAVFADLKERLLPLVSAVTARAGRNEDAPLHGHFDEAGQESFGLHMVERFGFDFSRGRLDRAVHPFESAFSPDDVRITTRYDTSYLADSLFSTLHEAGHGMYEQGVSRELEGTPLATGASSAVHESQSRLWENRVGRSLPVWEHFYPRLQETFPAQLGDVSLDRFYLAINRVQPSFIRVDADEVTYNLHIMLRYEMERALLSGEIAAGDAADVWNARMKAYLGIRPPSDRLGILQDTHWASGWFGYFPTYALGNVLSLQFFDCAVGEHPEIEEEMARGEFTTLRQWLTEHVYRHGRRMLPEELVEQATGSPLTTEPYLNYLERKFGSLYGLAVTPT